jgi:glycosyltransferase involved in cell wall biosynthesis
VSAGPDGRTAAGSPAAPSAAAAVERETGSASVEDGPAPSLTVGIPTHDHPAFLEELVSALEVQTFDRERFEVIVVDDASAAETWRLLERIAAATPLRLRAIRLAANSGPAAARNAAASRARAPALVFVDDDCLPDPGWLSAYARAFAGDADLVQGRTLGAPEPSLGPWARTVWVTGESWLFESCNIGYRTASFERLGGFDAERPAVTGRSRPHFGEDAELGWRFRAAGMRTTFSADALVHHRTLPGSFGDWLRETRRRSLFPSLLKRSPRMREALFLRTFLDRDTASFDLAVAGAATAAATAVPWFAAAAVPWLWRRWRRSADLPGKPRLVRAAQLALGDAVGLFSLLEGSLRARRIVL